MAGVEDELRHLSAQGTQRLSVGHGCVEGFERFGTEDGASAVDGQVLARYGTELARTGKAAPWPPERNASCWCGAGREYKKCCGDPSRRGGAQR
ncbi:SEC-C metal-binding domain-containing protein [Nocardiopsis suaedae]|uniref:SEC-C metal-binding domain-containing protein n=1 Tax=Nocardiopsis suaedae TaxID=3018444 RepID=A0ABT4TNJ9_9ACTN|nr:SEC-C metal-binding domain-containing protein [Nocardiopsis suaedae]MDA2806261.1 SEC-C metal-binding domain-containing protein [Nocardiopsis suaedae]